MTSKLYVGNLPFSLDNDGLEQLFAAYGAVTSARVISDRFSGRSKGYGFVEMETANGAESSIEALNGKDIGGRAISVAIALPRQDGGGAGEGGGSWDRPRRPHSDRDGGDRGGYRDGQKPPARRY